MIPISNVESISLNGKYEQLFVFFSILIQLPFAFFLGHYYDQRLFMATGYVVNFGADPYNPIELVHVFPNPLLNGFISPIGYPPPWPLVLGFIYRFSYNVIPNVLIYNFATKVPIIAANVTLAYLVRNFLVNMQVKKKKANAAWLFLLFNPFPFLTTTAWGQIDSVAALLLVGSLYELNNSYFKTGGFLMGASIAIKPLALPLAPLPLLFSGQNTVRKRMYFAFMLLATIFALWISPLFLLGWSQIACLACTTGRFGMLGGMTVFNVAEIIQNSTTIPSSLWFLAFLWIPVLVIAYYFVYRNPPRNGQDLVCASIGLTLVVFLTRSWLSEPNVNLILPLAVIAFTLGKMSGRILHLIWIVPIFFMIANAAVPQLFFLVYPSVLADLAQFDASFGLIRLSARFAIAVLWSILGWIIAVQMLRKNDEKGK